MPATRELLDALLHEALDAAASAEPDESGLLPADVQDYLDALAELAGEWGGESVIQGAIGKTG